VLQDVLPRAEHGSATEKQGLARVEARDRGELRPDVERFLVDEAYVDF
jgi:hypothetical protein